MLRMQVVRSAGVPYYVRDLVPGRAEGTGVAGESPGVWTGGGSAVLGVRGTVGVDEFVAVFAGRDPVGDRALRSGSGPRAVAGVDLVFCAPKSVSLLHLLAPREVADVAGSAHRHAVVDAVDHLEQEALGVRRTRGGVTRHLGAIGSVAAGFVHRTSRTLDPHVHTHLVVANVAQGVDGVWSTVDTRRLFAHRQVLGAVYDSSLRRQLTERLGASFERGAGGRWQLVGVDPVLERLFAQRTASIEEHLQRDTTRRTPTGKRRAAFHAERPDKDPGPTVDGLRSVWRRRAADHGIDPADLVEVVGRSRADPGRGPIDPGDLAARLGILAGRRPTLDARDLLVTMAESAPGGLGRADLVAATDALVADLGPPGRDGPPTAVPASGGIVGQRWAADEVVRALDRDRPLVVDGRRRTGAGAEGKGPGRERAAMDRPARDIGRSVGDGRGRPGLGLHR